MNEEDVKIEFQKMREQLKKDWIVAAIKNGFSEQQAVFLFDTCKNSFMASFDIF